MWLGLVGRRGQRAAVLEHHGRPAGLGGGRPPREALDRLLGDVRPPAADGRLDPVPRGHDRHHRVAEPGPDLLQCQQPYQRLVPAAEREVELGQRPRRRGGGHGQAAVDRDLEHLVGEAAALGLVAAQAGEPGEAGERQRAGVLGPDVGGEPCRLVGVGGRLGQPPVPQREVGAQAEDVRQERDRRTLAGQDDGAVERLERAATVSDEDAAGGRPQDLARLVERLGAHQRLLEHRRRARRVAAEQAAERAQQQAGHRLALAPGLGVETGGEPGDLEHALRVAAHGGGLERASEQVEGGARVRRGATASAAAIKAACDWPGRPATISTSARIRAASRTAHRIVQLGLCAREQAQRMLHAARHDRRAGGRQQPLAAARRPELGGALERPRSGRRAAARAGAVGGPLQLLGGLLVGRDGRRRAVPGAPVVVEHGGQRLVHGAPLARGCRAVDRRPHQRMAEAQPLAVGVDQARRARPRRARRAAGRAARRRPAPHRARRSRRRRRARAGAARPRAAGGSGRGRRPRSRRSAAPRRAAARGRRAAPRDSARGSSSSASGLPCVTCTSWWRRVSGMPESSSAAAASARARRAQLRQPFVAALEPRADDQRDRVGVRRRAAKMIASADGRSSQCASSTTHSSGPSSATAVSSPSSATETRKRSSTRSAVSPSAPRSAAPWTPGSASARSSTGQTSWCRPANGSSDSASTAAPDSTRIPPARSTA